MNIFKRNLLSTIISSSLRMGEGGDDGEKDDGNNNQIDVNSQQFKDAVSKAATLLSADSETGLKNKNTELINKLKDANIRADQFEGMDPEKVRLMMQVFDDNEEAKLISEGKFEEVMKKRTDKIESTFHDKITDYKTRAELAEDNSSKFKTQLDQNTIRTEITNAALKSGVLGGAIEDVVQRAFAEFSIDDNGKVESRGADGVLRQTSDNLLMNPERFVEGLKESNSYYFPPSESAETKGSNSHLSGDSADAAVQNASKTTNGKLDLAQYRKSRQKQSGDNYHKRSKI